LGSRPPFQGGGDGCMGICTAYTATGAGCSAATCSPQNFCDSPGTNTCVARQCQNAPCAFDGACAPGGSSANRSTMERRGRLVSVVCAEGLESRAPRLHPALGPVIAGPVSFAPATQQGLVRNSVASADPASTGADVQTASVAAPTGAAGKFPT